ncbi:MAG: FtsW/RodA/SpoVE family cell cycle protein [Anaerolineaceae bacterium]
MLPFPSSPWYKDQIQSRLLNLAALFLFIYSLTLTLSPAARFQSWAVPLRYSHWIGFATWLVGAALIHRLIKKTIPERDPYLFPITALLSGWGLLEIWRLDSTFGARQSVWLVIALAVTAAGLLYPKLLVALRKYKYLWLTSGLLLTALTFFLGTYPGGNGPHLWFEFFGVYFQPSEVLKFLLITYLAAYLADRLPDNLTLAQLLAPTLILFLTAIAILVVQRDLGTATLFIVLFTFIVYLGTGRRRMVLITFFTILTAGLAGYYLFDLIRIRVDGWLNPWVDPSGRSYQIIQSLLAVANGGVLGRGVGMGSPGLVPVAHSDFIFSSIAEETGLVGSLALILLIALFVYRGFLASLRAPSIYQRLLAAGLTLYIGVQSILIIGGNIRLLPLTGVTLPLVSYGGSSLVTSFIAVTLLLRISVKTEEEPATIRNLQPMTLTSMALMGALFLITLSIGWWSFFRSDDLLARTDNPRRSISDRFVKRGSILDRSGQPINNTTGTVGSYERSTAYPDLSSIVGYTHPVYGQAGLEASLDHYLRGLQGNPASSVWSNYLIYGTPPPGLDIRLTVDLVLQEKADELLHDHKGALVLLNAKTGEILAISSHPTFDSNQLEENWSDWVSDPDAPLFNRAVQAKFDTGTALAPFILAASLEDDVLPALPSSESFTYQGQIWECRLASIVNQEWGGAIAAGCPNPLASLTRRLPTDRLFDLLATAGFYSAPSVPLDSALPDPNLAIIDSIAGVFGSEMIQVSPLQMALAAAALSENGLRPMPRLAMSVNSPIQGWVILPGGDPVQFLPASGADLAATMLAAKDFPIWEASGGTPASSSGSVSWYLSGTLPSWQGTPLAMALVLEENNPGLAQSIGRQMILTAQSQ